MELQDCKRARWVWCPDAADGTAGFFWFKNRFELKQPTVLRFAVSADHRYNLYCDGELLGRGPARSDLQHYRYEEYEVALKPGPHLLAAEVIRWHCVRRGGGREEAPWSELHAGGGFLVIGGAPELDLTTPGTWLCAVDATRKPRVRGPESDLPGGPMPPPEEHDYYARLGDWRAPEIGGRVYWNPEPGEDTSDAPWWLEPRPIPQQEQFPVPVARMQVSGEAQLKLEQGRVVGSIPAGRTTLRLDLGSYQTGIPQLFWEGGAGVIEIAYAESGRREGRKLRRDDFEAEFFHGNLRDRIRFPAGAWSFAPFWYRAGRYLELVFELEEPLTRFEFGYDFLGYPFRLRAEFRGDAKLESIWRAAWRTARCCAHEHYEDCPYYEQMQYAGDTRIQALISYAATGDGRLGLQAIRQFRNSRLPNGLTQSRYPSLYPQVIPEFSLFWTLMVADYYRYFGDRELLEECRADILGVFDYFERRKLANGLIGPVGFWSITDWTRQWTGPTETWDPALTGTSHRGLPEPETIVALLYSYCCSELAPLLELPELTVRARQLCAAVNELAFDRELGLYVDLPGRKFISEHANALAILAGAVTGKAASELADRVAANEAINRTSLYFAFYLFEAWRKLGRADLLLARCGQWGEMLDWGFTTFPEVPTLDGRSDCHAWSASPLYFMITMLLGVTPAAPGFRRVAIAPTPGPLTGFSGRVPLGPERLLELEVAAREFRVRTSAPVSAVIGDCELELPPGETFTFPIAGA